MTWIFRVAYGTVVGESLWLDMAMHDGGNVIGQVLPMKWRDAGHWELEISAEMSKGASLEYGYLYKREGLELKEWGGARVWEREGESVEKIVFLDDWRSAGSLDRVYEAKIFQSEEGRARTLAKTDFLGNHELNLQMAQLPEGMVPCVMGGPRYLGEWDYHKAVPMVEVEKNLWRTGMDLPMDLWIEYKYGLYSISEGKAVKLEDGANRVLDESRNGTDLVRISDESFRRSADHKFRGAGVAIPVFSLRSEAGCGVGEFLDLKAMADWAARTGLGMIQILPINDTTSTRTKTDSYPYSAISVFALHPIYLRLDEMSYPLADTAAFGKERAALNCAKHLDYEAVMAVKWKLTRGIFDRHHDTILRDEAFLAFLKRNSDWVLDYGVFCVKRDEYGTADFTQWGQWAAYDSKTAEALAISTEVVYFVWLQYELDRQLADAVAHMRTLGVALKGDLPIGVDRESVDAWVGPHLFKMDGQAGAPPDAFATKGQNWGFPTYNWEEMSKDGYAWWRSRFGKLSRYFDAYRIDHILGFFRIWQVPMEHIEGILGCFDPALPVKLGEFAERGINFDYARFCKPFLRETMLKEKFGELETGVRQDFLIDLGSGCYALKDDLSTQRGVLEFFGKLKEGDWANQEWLRAALLDLVAEVLFIEVDGSGGTEFHPRMSMRETESFKALDDDVKWRVEELYEDYFFRRQESFWEAGAYEKLPAMRNASDMLLCGEDLGMVPACVPGVMANLGILSLEIQRWPKEPGSTFSHPARAPYMSVVATGTHDMSTLRGWWLEDEKVRAKFAWEMFGIAFPGNELSGEIARRIIEQHLLSPAMWAVFPLQDLLAMDENLRSDDIEGERINVPAIIPFIWGWRMELSIQDLANADEFNWKLRELIETAGR